jgi:transcription initiation factor TFIID TATA-box-binding protein
MQGAEFLGLTDELNEKTLREYEELAANPNAEAGDPDAPAATDEVAASPLRPVIVNIVACVNYGTELDLLKIATHARNAEYNPKRFPAVTLRIQSPKATGLTFKTGIMNIVGCRTEESSYLAARKFGRILKDLGFNVRLKSFSIVNIVATMDCRFPIHLESLASSAHKNFTQYNPEIFAGLVYRYAGKPASPGCTFLVFVSGKLVVTGASTIESIMAAANYIYPILQQFARSYVPPPLH